MYELTAIDFPAVATMAPYMQEEEVAVTIILVVFGFFFSAWFLFLRSRDRRRRMDLLESALRSGNLSPDAQVELVRQLRSFNEPRRWMFSVGWLGLFLGIAWLCTEPHGDEMTAAAIVTGLGFAFVTLPLAQREVEARQSNPLR